MPPMMIKHKIPPAQKLLDEIGDISNLEIFNNQILCAVYIRPTETVVGGKAFFLTDNQVDEDKYQSKMGLVVKMGASAFQDKSGNWFKDITVEEGDWLILRPSDGWSITVNGVLCRIMEDSDVKGRHPNPDAIW